MTITRFNLAVDKKMKDQGADFISCVAFNKTAEFISKYFSKGSKLALEGHINTGSYTNKDGNKVYTTDVVVDAAEFCESKKQDNSSKPSANDGFMYVPDGLEDSGLPFNS